MQKKKKIKYVLKTTDIETLKFFIYHCVNPLDSFYGNVGDVSEEKIRQILSDYKEVFPAF